MLKIQSLGKQNHGDDLLVLDIRSVLSAASFSASPSAGQGLGKEWERKSIRFDKREVCKSCWSSLQRPWQEPQELRQASSHPTWWAVRSRAVLATDLDILIPAFA